MKSSRKIEVLTSLEVHDTYQVAFSMGIQAPT